MVAFEAKKRAYAEIEARFFCTHEVREVRHRVIADGRSSFVSQCVRCGNTSSPIKAHIAKQSGGNIPEYDYRLETRWRAAKDLAYKEVREAIRPELKAEYEAYLRSPEWHQLRAAVFERCGGICEVCEDAAAKQAHHFTYERIGHEELADLLGVCKPCHELIHGPRST
jgi:hypothetical protein